MLDVKIVGKRFDSGESQISIIGIVQEDKININIS